MKMNAELAPGKLVDGSRRNEQARHASGSTLRFLVVDDNEDAADMLSLQLQRRGFVTRTRYSGDEALALCNDETFDVALVDLGMPAMDGWTLARCLRRKMPGVLILAVTGYGSDRARIRSTQAGIDAHLVKPVCAEDIFEMMQRIQTDEQKATG